MNLTRVSHAICVNYSTYPAPLMGIPVLECRTLFDQRHWFLKKYNKEMRKIHTIASRRPSFSSLFSITITPIMVSTAPTLFMAWRLTDALTTWPLLSGCCNLAVCRKFNVSVIFVSGVGRISIRCLRWLSSWWIRSGDSRRWGIRVVVVACGWTRVCCVGWIILPTWWRYCLVRRRIGSHRLVRCSVVCIAASRIRCRWDTGLRLRSVIVPGGFAGGREPQITSWTLRWRVIGCCWWIISVIRIPSASGAKWCGTILDIGVNRVRWARGHWRWFWPWLWVVRSVAISSLTLWLTNWNPISVIGAGTAVAIRLGAERNGSIMSSNCCHWVHSVIVYGTAWSEWRSDSGKILVLSLVASIYCCRRTTRKIDFSIVCLEWFQWSLIQYSNIHHFYICFNRVDASVID